MSIILRHLPSFKPSPLRSFQLLSLSRSFARSKKIDPKVIPAKYDVNPPRSFTYSYENIPDNLPKSGRKSYIYSHGSSYKKSRYRKEYLDFKEQEKKASVERLGEEEYIDEPKAKQIIEYLKQYNREHPMKGKKSEQVELNVKEILKAEIKPYKMPPGPDTANYTIPEEVKMSVEEQVREGEDPVWGTEKPVERKYDRIRVKELFWISRSEKHFKDSNRRLGYLVDFVGPYVIHDAEIMESIQSIRSKTPEAIANDASPESGLERVYMEDKEIVEIFKKLKVQIMKSHYKQLPNIALSLTFDLRYRNDVYKIWSYIEKEFFQNLHHFSLLEIAKIRYALAGIMPKIGSVPLHKACVDLCQQEIKQANIYDVQYLYTAFKNLNKNKVHKFFYNELISRKEEAASLVKQDPDLIANLIYTYANSRIAKRFRDLIRSTDEDVKEAEKYIDTFYDDLMASFNKMSLEATVRLSVAFTILRVENYIDVLTRIQKKVLENLDKMDAFLVSSILYSFSKFSKGRAEGDLKFYNQLTGLVERFWPEFTDKDKARIFYAYTARGFKRETCGLIESIFIPWAKESVHRQSYTELSNTIMSLMFLRYVDREFWTGFLRNVAKQQYVVPLSHYYNFQICKHYLSIFYPKWSLKPLDQATFEAANIFNTERVPRPTENEEFLDFYRVLQFKYQINNKPFLEWENLLTIDIAILPQKVGVLKQGIVENFSDSYDIRPILSLKKFILDNKGWKIWLLNWKEYLDQGANKDEWFKKNFSEVYIEQSVRFSRKADEEAAKGPFEKYYDWYHYWAPKLSIKPKEFTKETDENGNVKLTREIKWENLDSRAFAKFGKQGPVKAPAAGAPGGGAKPAAPAKAPAASAKPGGK